MSLLDQNIICRIRLNWINLKKTLIEIQKNNKHKEILYFDESRFGTHSKIGRSWRKTGIRSEVLVKLGFKNFHLYSSINSKSGHHYTLLLPYVNTDCMNLYLEGLSQDLKKHNKEAVVIMDGAGWHKSKGFRVPDNIKIEILPPYCPELNPVERLRQYIKGHTIKNKVFNSLTELENAVCLFVKEMSRETVISICNQERI